MVKTKSFIFDIFRMIIIQIQCIKFDWRNAGVDFPVHCDEGANSAGGSVHSHLRAVNEEMDLDKVERDTYESKSLSLPHCSGQGHP